MEDVKTGIDRKTHRLREESLARKRNQEYHKQLFWNDITNYYKTWDVQASKYNFWASQPPTPVSPERQKEIEEKSLEERRATLAKLLADEQQQYEEELKEFRRRQKQSRYSSTPDEEMEAMNVELMLKDEEARRYKAALQKYHEGRSAHPLLQEIERKKCQQSMKQTWIEQMKEKQAQQETEKELMQKLDEESAQQRFFEEEKEKETLRRKQEETKSLREFLLTQMEEVKKKDKLTQQLKQQEQQEIKLKTELEEIAVRRNQIEKQRRTKEFRSFLRHQYQMQLKQRTREIQEELKEDKRLIDEITRCLEREEKENNKIREETRKEIDRANAMLAEYTRLEKQREREMEFMFFEEARKMWQKQESNWNAEQEARNKLLRDVLVTVQKQVKEKLQRNTEQHKLLVDEKEDLLKKIEDVNTQLKESERESALRKKGYRADLQQQIREKELEKENAKLEEEKEFRERQAKLNEEEEKILNELRKMTTSNSVVRRKLTH